MNYGGLALRALILTVCMWPLMRGFAFGDLTHGAVGMPTQRSTGTHGQLLLAKHDDGDSDEDEQGEYKHHRHGRHHDASEGSYADQQFCGPYFRSSSVPYFRNYYSRDDYANLPPGLRKHLLKTGHLPPGLEKKYERTGQLPPGLQKRFKCGQTLPAAYSPYLYPVPDVAYEKVGPLPPDSRLYLYGQDLLLLNYHTRAIIDILRGAY